MPVKLEEVVAAIVLWLALCVLLRAGTEFEFRVLMLFYLIYMLVLIDQWKLCRVSLRDRF